jgi:hypothetical protein
MAVNNPYPQYTKKNPAAVEAYQWLPEDTDHTIDVLTWLMHYRKTRFIIQPSDDSFESKQLIGFHHNGAEWDDYAFPGDWIVRRGSNSYSVYDNDDFHASFGDEEPSDD